jgi:hypothetical protein
VAGLSALWSSTFSALAPRPPDGVEAEAPGQAVLHDLDDLGDAVLGIAGLDEVEVGAVALRGAQVGHAAGVYPVGVGDDLALSGLAEDLGEARHGHGAGADDIGQHLARPHRGELVHVTDKDQRRLVRQCLHQGRHQGDVHHGGLVNHEQVALQRIVQAALEAPVPGVHLQEAVDGLRLHPGAFREALGCPSRGGCEGDLDALHYQDAQDGVHQGRLAHAGSTGDHHALR